MGIFDIFVYDTSRYIKIVHQYINIVYRYQVTKVSIYQSNKKKNLVVLSYYYIEKVLIYIDTEERSINTSTITNVKVPTWLHVKHLSFVKTVWVASLTAKVYVYCVTDLNGSVVRLALPTLNAAHKRFFLFFLALATW